MSEAKTVRLSRAIVPKHYDLTIQPNLENFTFDGKVCIDIQIEQTTKTIILHAVELEIKQAIINECSGKIELDQENELAKIDFDREFQKGDYQLSLIFNGQILERMVGFYRNRYSKPTRYGASTQFEPADCRRVFPCWDEPNFKATFDITLITSKHLRAISNMPIKFEGTHADDNQWKVTKFERTPVMSTYLVAFVVGEYDYIETKDSNGIELRVYTPVGKKEYGRFALETTSKILPFYSDYFQVQYPIAKLDQIAIPDFPTEGMENWGLITYRESALLIDPKSSSMEAQQRVATVVAHELAHQWFGNLVTMDWWTDLWLNEGFASWIENLAVEKLYPEFDIWTQFLANTFAKFLRIDSLKSSHPIEVTINHPDEIKEIFDEISYFKSSSLLRMLHDYIGDNAFRQGLHNYLEEFSYRNATTNNLWSHLAQTSNKPVEQVMSTWTQQIGYPVLIVTEEQQSNTKRIVKLTQQRFLIDGSKDTDCLQWKIPITLFTKSNPNGINQEFLMEQSEMIITLDNLPSNDWIKLNYHSFGLYRVKYSSDNLKRFNESIANTVFSPQDRLMIQDDLAALCYAGYYSFVDYLQLLLSYQNEDNFTVWKSIVEKIDDLYSLFEYTDYLEQFKNYCLKLFSSIHNKLGWNVQSNENSLLAMLRPTILNVMGRSGDKTVVHEAQQRFQCHLNGDFTDPNLRDAVYALVAHFGDEQTYDQLRNLYETTDMTEEKARILRAMGQSLYPEIIEKTLEFIFESDYVRMQETTVGLRGCTSTRIGRELVWKYLQTNWTKLAKRFGNKSISLIYFVQICLSNFADEQTAHEIKMFYDSVNTPVVSRVIEQAIEIIHMRSQALKRDSKMIKDFFINGSPF